MSTITSAEFAALKTLITAPVKEETIRPVEPNPSYVIGWHVTEFTRDYKPGDRRDESITCQTRYSLPDVFLSEVWTNVGRAGLIRYEMIGWRFVSGNDVEEAAREHRHGPWSPLVYFIDERPGDRPKGVPST